MTDLNRYLAQKVSRPRLLTKEELLEGVIEQYERMRKCLADINWDRDIDAPTSEWYDKCVNNREIYRLFYDSKRRYEEYMSFDEIDWEEHVNSVNTDIVDNFHYSRGYQW